MKVEQIAKVCHESNRAYCESLGDTSQKPWENADQWQKDSAINGVKFIMAHPSSGPDAAHQNWLNEKLEAGWRYGPVKDVEKREHPCMLPYAKLPIEQRRKDYLFAAVVAACLSDDDND